MARAGAAFVAQRARQAVEASGSFHFAVSGGHTPWAMFAELASETVPWERVVIYQVDERVAPPDDPDRNLHHLHDALGTAPAQVEAMPVNDEDLDAAAATYAPGLARPLRPGPPGPRARRAHRLPGTRRPRPRRVPTAW